MVIDLEMPKSRQCPKCGGKMFFYTDLESWYAECVECSYRYNLMDIAGDGEASSQSEKDSIPEDKP
jgi:uncharacterized protein (DUF983 family)